MTNLIRRYCTPLTVAALLLAFIAAPYLTALNPDSALFRSGLLGCVLLLGCFSPVRHALHAHPLRSLVYGCAFALVFSVCLSLGSELQVYDGLLPGMGSLVRRLAVPFMITPLLGAFASYAFVISPKLGASKKRPIPYAVFFCLLALCYGAVLLALYPGVISYDFEHEIRQYATGVYEAAHPVFHTLFLGSLFDLGEALFCSMTAGAAMYSAVQLLLLAAVYAYACAFVQRHTGSRLIACLLAAAFALLPFHGAMAVSTAKDPLFSGLCVLLCLFLWEAAQAPQAVSKWHMVRFSACCLGIALLRHNGVFAYLPACLILPLILHDRRKALALMGVTLALAFLIPRGIEWTVGAQKTPSSEMMSIPCQQLMRTARHAKLSEAEFEQVERWFPDATHTYRPHCADPAKGGNFNLGRYQKDPMDFWTTYAKYALKQPRVYVEAFLFNCIGMWDPNDTSHAHRLSSEEGENIYLNTTYPFPPERYPIEPDNKFPALQKAIYAFTHDSVHQKIPVLAQIFCPSTYSFALLLTTLLLLYRRRRKAALCALPLWGIFVSVLFSAGTFIRYAYPLMAAVPVLAILAFFTQEQNAA